MSLIYKKNNLDVLLIAPRHFLTKNDIRRCVPPTGLAYLASFLEQRNYSVEILDVANKGHNIVNKKDKLIVFGLDDEEVKNEIILKKPQFVGISCVFSPQDDDTKRIARLVKNINKNIITIIGGPHATFAVEEMIEEECVDFVVLGEGEKTLLKLLDVLNNGGDVTKITGIASKRGKKKIINQGLQFIENLDDIPFPARHLLDMEKYFEVNLPENPYPKGQRVVQLTTSRGCSARCIFCSTSNFFGNRFRSRSSKNVASELDSLVSNYGIDEIQITDDNWTLDQDRAYEIIKEIKKHKLFWCSPQGVAVWTLNNNLIYKMAESGCYQLTFAIESGNQEVLTNFIKKPLKLKKVKPLVQAAHSAGIKVHAFCICGIPGETINNMYETYDFVEDCDFDSASFFVATPMIGSDLLELCRREKYLKKGYNTNMNLLRLGNITTPEFHAEDVEKLVNKFNLLYNK